MPAEWEQQSGILLTWPHENSDWKDQLQQIESVYLKLAFHICKHEALLVICNDQTHQQKIQRQLQQARVNLKSVRFGIAPSNDTWVRDYGPITVISDNCPQLLDFIFDGWGEKYPAALDNQITNSLHKTGFFGDTLKTSINLVLEGGSIESDGQDTLLTTHHCLFNRLRNKLHNQEQIEHQLTECFGLKRILALKHGSIKGDDTDGHIDTLARFCDPNTIAYVSCDDSEDEHYKTLKAMESELRNFTTLDNRNYQLIQLPLPKPIHNKEGARLPATYANFLIINGAVLVPVYDDLESEKIALENLSICFPDREIIGINCIPLIQQFGSLHCATMQLLMCTLFT